MAFLAEQIYTTHRLLPFQVRIEILPVEIFFWYRFTTKMLHLYSQKKKNNKNPLTNQSFFIAYFGKNLKKKHQFTCAFNLSTSLKKKKLTSG